MENYFYDGVFYERVADARAVRRRHYLKLIKLGMNSTAAARVVGVSKRTAKVWRNGRSRSSGRNEKPKFDVYDVPMCLRREDKGKPTTNSRFTLDDRGKIADGLILGLTHREIAERVGKNQSSVSREISNY